MLLSPTECLVLIACRSAICFRADLAVLAIFFGGWSWRKTAQISFVPRDLERPTNSFHSLFTACLACLVDNIVNLFHVS